MIRFEQFRWAAGERWLAMQSSKEAPTRADLLLVFGGREAMAVPAPFAALSARYPGAVIAGCSTAGEILGTEVSAESLVATALSFDATRVTLAVEEETSARSGTELGMHLATQLTGPGLVHVLIFVDGIGVNGSELVRGLEAGLPAGVLVTGGLAGDGDRFAQTLVHWGVAFSTSGIVGIGFHGDRLRVGHGTLGGWDPFGPERRITRSRGNVLYELDSRPALELYRLYLGEQAEGLPATGLRFPLSLRVAEGETGVVRTIVGIDENEGSLTFAGDVPEGHLARLMKANLDRLIDGAAGAATGTLSGLCGVAPQVALLISCVGRKMVLNQRVEEEVEAVRQVLGPEPALTGFYSYGEISPLLPHARCELHNQTMTITALAEA